MIVRVLDDKKMGTTGAVAEGIRYAAENGARIINLSLGGDQGDPRMDAAIKVAGNANALVVASAGNDGRNIDSKPSYPAAIPAANLLAVAATDPDRGSRISEFSNYGRLTVQVAAPGAGILSTSHDGGWEIKSGTSMAAPMVTGVAALAASVNPRISATDLRAVLMQNATRSNLPVAAGYVDALHSVLTASSASGYDTTQPPRIKILAATRKGARAQVQAAVLGSTAAIRRYRVAFGKRTVAELTARRSPFRISVRRPGASVRITALDASGRPLTATRGKVTRLRRGKRGVGSGGGVGA
jgi:subtilisin family serine protease